MKLTPKWSRLVFFAVILGMMLAGTDAANQKVCTEDEAKGALDEADRLKDWNAVYCSFKRFGHCDDEAIAEGYGDNSGPVARQPSVMEYRERCRDYEK